MNEILTETAHHPLGDGELTLLGAVHGVTGAMTRVDLGGARVLVDAGITQGGSRSRDRSPPDAAYDVDAIVLTHAHNDHVGNLPALLSRGFSGPIWGTPATLSIARLVLLDAMRLRDVPASERTGVLQRFDAMSRRAPYDSAFEPVRGKGLTAWLREAGHILGSASVELRAPSARIVLSGDLGRPGSPLLRDYHERWERGRPVDLVVMESTYGDRDHAGGTEEVTDALERILKRAIARRGHVLVPAFAIGRTQALLWHMNALVEAGRIPAVPVAVDTPMGLEVTDTYQRFARLFDAEALARIAQGDEPLEFESLFSVRRGRDSQRLRSEPGPIVVVAGSGMCTGGRIVGHLAELLPREETTVVFAGHQGEGTPGRRIQEVAGEPGASVELDGERVPVRAAIETLSGMSAHADRAELARWLRGIPDVRRVVLHHGEPDAQRGLARYLSAPPAAEPSGPQLA